LTKRKEEGQKYNIQITRGASGNRIHWGISRKVDSRKC